MLLRQLFDPDTSTYTYLVADEQTREAALIDPVREQVDRDLGLVRELGLALRYALDTHVHADHVTATGMLRELTGCTTVGSKLGAACADVHIGGGDRLPLGSLTIEVLATPGHTDDSVSYRVEDNVFTGDAMLVRGTGRTDFQNGDANQLYDSITRVLFALPAATRVWPGHDYRGHTVSTIEEERRFNPKVAGKTREEFVAIMKNLGLPRPRYMDVAVPANRACGESSVNQSEPRWTEVLEITPAELDNLPTGVRVIDVREREEFEGEFGHLPQARLVPLGTLRQAAADWSRVQPVLLVCRSGRRSLDAARQLVQLGFEQVMNLDGGMIAVRRQGAR